MAASPLVYPTGDFVPFTKILSSEVNGKFNAITTLLNVTKLSATNLQTDSIMYQSQLTNQAVITNASGQLTTTVFLPAANGGTGFVFASTTLNIAKVVQSNAAGTALTLDVVPVPATDKIFSYWRFG